MTAFVFFVILFLICSAVIFLEFISEDELVEITPESIRLRKKELDENKRASMKKKLKSEH